MKKQVQVKISKEKIAEFCCKHHIRKLSLFGSVLQRDFGPRSDVDVLVEFEPGHVIGLLRMAGMENELSRILRRKVDLRTPEDLSPYFRTDVMHSASIQYAQR